VLSRWPGLIDPDELLPQLDLGEALVGLRRGRFKEAIALLERAATEWPSSVAAPEALYWIGNVRYVMDGDRDALDAARERLVERYPGSAAARRV
jgi:TolA-binding protein